MDGYMLPRFLGKLMFVGLAGVTLLGCQGSDVVVDSTSELNQISRQRFSCVKYDSSETSSIFSDAPSGFFRNWSSGEEQKVKSLLASLPDDYINHLYEARQKAGFAIIQEPLGSGIAGLTMLGYYSQWAKVAPGQVDWALIHEIGHALHYYIDRESGGAMQNDLSSAYNRERRNPGIAGYPQSSSTEWFAESFQSYNCGEEAQAFMKNTIPETWEFFEKYVKAPRWQDPSSNPGGSGSGNNNNNNNNDDFNGIDTNTAEPSPIKLLTYLENPSNPLGVTKVLLSAPQDYLDVQLCLGSLSQCAKGLAQVVKFYHKQNLPNGRKIYETEHDFQFVQKQAVSVVGLNSLNERKGAEVTVSPVGFTF